MVDAAREARADLSEVEVEIVGVNPERNHNQETLERDKTACRFNSYSLHHNKQAKLSPEHAV